MKKRVAAYCRVSGSKVEQLLSLKMQIEYFENILSVTPDIINIGVFYDCMSSLRKNKRKGFKELINWLYFASLKELIKTSKEKRDLALTGKMSLDEFKQWRNSSSQKTAAQSWDGANKLKKY